ncbi:hypothetical protein BGW39_011818 [Mortierella sp. 14UC]|nr:hypothetical protein BGW39_011818 [Mortierella sp. 14UC]
MKPIHRSSILVVLIVVGTMIPGTQAAPVTVGSPTATAPVETPTPVGPVESPAVNSTVELAAYDPGCAVRCITAHNVVVTVCEGFYQGLELARCKASAAATFIACHNRCL